MAWHGMAWHNMTACCTWPHAGPVACCFQVRDQLMDWLCEREMAVYQVRHMLSQTDD